MLNTNLMKHPANWLVLLLMVLIAGVGGQLVLAYFGITPATADSK
jgi:hypothetical protein